MSYYYDNNQSKNLQNKSISFVPKCVYYFKKIERLGRNAISMKYDKQANDIISNNSFRIPDSSYSSLALACMNSSPLFPIYKKENRSWYGNRTQNSIKADRQFKEYFYHCIRNIDYPMRVNYCWDFSLKHEDLFKKTMAKRKLSQMRSNSSNSGSSYLKNSTVNIYDNNQVKKNKDSSKMMMKRKYKKRKSSVLSKSKKLYYNINAMKSPKKKFKFLPLNYKKERARSGSSGFGSGLINFKTLMSKRKKSAPEQESSRKNLNEDDDEPDTYASKVSIHSNNSTNLHTYYIYLNESCCVEVAASQQSSSVQNLLTQALRKMKAAEDINDYCLVEQIELEQPIQNEEPSVTNTSVISTNYNNISKNPSSTGTKTTMITTSSTKTLSSHNNMILKKRILGPNENLFILSHVWNQMKNEKKDGFKCGKVILTKRKSFNCKNSSLKNNSESKPSGLKHHFSLHSRLTSKAIKSLNIIDHKSQSPNKDTSSHLSSSPNHHKSLAVQRNRTKSSLNRLVRQKSFEESFENLDDGKNNILENTEATTSAKVSKVNGHRDLLSHIDDVSFETTKTEPKNNLMVRNDEKLTTFSLDQMSASQTPRGSIKSAKKVTEVVESSLALSTEVILQKEDDEEEDNDYEEDLKDDYQLIHSNTVIENDVKPLTVIETDTSDLKTNAENSNITESCTSDSDTKKNEKSTKKSASQRQSTLQRLFKLKF